MSRGRVALGPALEYRGGLPGPPGGLAATCIHARREDNMYCGFHYVGDVRRAHPSPYSLYSMALRAVS